VAAPEPLYVLATDASANTVTVGRREELATRAVGLRNAVLQRDGERVDAVKLRYRSRPLAAAVAGDTGAGRHERLRIELEEPAHGVAPGQTAVLLAGEAIVGHGTIA
jgi:tRNA-uridine 2-sulfurtransferase